MAHLKTEKPSLSNVCPYCFAPASLEGYLPKLFPSPIKNIKGEICENCGKRYWRDRFNRTIKYEDVMIRYIIGAVCIGSLIYMALTRTSC